MEENKSLWWAVIKTHVCDCGKSSCLSDLLVKVKGVFYTHDEAEKYYDTLSSDDWNTGFQMIPILSPEVFKLKKEKE